jgi:hypothetical protein
MGESQVTSKMPRRNAICCLIAIAACLLVGCAAPLLNSNTMELSATVDSLITRQVIYNLTKIQENRFALPAQAQIPQGQVTTTLSVNSNVTAALNPMSTATAMLASTGASSTITKVNTNTLSGNSAVLGGTVSGMQDWVVNTVLDPEALRRLRLLYQYATGQILAIDLLCEYPIPQMPNKSDSQQQNAKGKSADGQPGANKNANQGSAGKGKKTVYVRAYKCQHQPENLPAWVTVGPNPDPAFLNSPGCVLCAYSNKDFRGKIKTRERIFDNVVTDHSEPYDLQKNDYVEVVVNDYLLPNDGHLDNKLNYDRKYWLQVDWLYVVRNGDPIPDNSRAVGSANGYTVYVTPDVVMPRRQRETPPNIHVPGTIDPDEYQKSGNFHFSEFVLAIIEATLQSPEIQKVAQPAPTVTTNLK